MERRSANILVDTNSENHDLFYAVHNFNAQLLMELLVSGAFDVNKTDQFGQTALHCVLANEFAGDLNSDALLKCVQLLLNHGADVHLKDSNQQTPLHLAIRNHFVYIVRILLQRGASTTLPLRSNCSTMLATNLVYAMSEIMLEIFDNAVNVSPDLTLYFDWSVFQSPSQHSFSNCEENDMHFLCTILGLKDKSVKDQLLRHPLVSVFVKLKEKRFRSLQILSDISFVLYTLTYYGFVHELYFTNCVPENKNVTTYSEEIIDEQCTIPLIVSILAYLLIGYLSIWSLTELVIYVLPGRNDLISWRNWVNRVALVFIVMSLWPGLQFDELYDISWQFPFAALGFFFFWVTCLIRIGSFPSCSVYLEMLVKVLLTATKICIFFFPLLIGFYEGFSIMFTNTSGTFHFILMSFDMGAGDYENLMNGIRMKNIWFAAVGYTFCTIFILMITIVFINFILGAIINDMRELKRNAEISAMSRNIQNLCILEYVDYGLKYICRLLTRGNYQLQSTVPSEFSLRLRTDQNRPESSASYDDLTTQLLPDIRRLVRIVKLRNTNITSNHSCNQANDQLLVTNSSIHQHH